MSVFRKTYFYYLTFEVFIFLILLSRSVLPLSDPIESVRAFTRDIEFDYIVWTLDAIKVKFGQGALNTVHYLDDDQRHDFVIRYIALVIQIQNTETNLENIYSDPAIENPGAVAVSIKDELSRLYQQRDLLGPLAESIIQNQLAQVVSDVGLSMIGQPVPPILYRTTPLPLALIVSPREVIRQDADISLVSNLTIDQIITLENTVDEARNVSSLVEEVGGVGVYPTMVMQTRDLNWLVEVVAHEWTHNYLTLRPLGLNYSTSPELRTMNETTANIAGKEIGKLLIAHYYPELLPPPVEDEPLVEESQVEESGEPPVFNFQHEMHLTRLIVDRLLEAGKIEQAEEFMEKRRQYFWDNGYHIRKLNQAYFAFHGAYADEAVSAAGEDPVGAAVRALRASSPTLKDFIKTISWMVSYQQLQELMAEK
ncbi:MAG: hypothetical protein JW908_14460 [Anaerolineales bacterium]|nr:hypothetical protein [Anaerolineales bacterium]